MSFQRIALLAVLASPGGWAERPAGETQPEPRAALIWSDADTDVLGAPSPDGRFLSFVDQSGSLAVRDLGTGTNRAVAGPTGGDDFEQFAYFSIFAPSAERIAYAWFNEEGYYDLRIVDLATSEVRVLYRNREAGFVQPCAFSPDGEQILTLFFRRDNVSQIALVSAEDGSIRILRSLDWFYPKKIDLSPDGRFVVYDSTTGGESPTRDILVLAIDGSFEATVTDHPADDLSPLWTPNGRAVVFGSDRRGPMDLWSVPMREGRPSGETTLVKRDLGRALPMAFTREGRLFYGLRTGRSDAMVAGFDPASGALTEEPTPVRSRFQGANRNPEWSPDGRMLAYLSRVGSENYGQEHRAVTVLDVDTGVETVHSPRLAYIERLRWSPDSSALLLSGSDAQGRAGLFTMDLAADAAQQAVVEHGGDFRGFEGDWTADGKSIYFVQQAAPSGSLIRSHDLTSGQKADVYRPSRPARIYAMRRARERDALAFAQSANGGHQQSLLVLEPGADAAKQILHLQYGRLTGIDWHTDDNGLLVSTEAAGKPALWSVSFSDDEPRRLEAPWIPPGSIRTNADGTRVAFTRGSRQSEVRVIEMPTAAAR